MTTVLRNVASALVMLQGCTPTGQELQSVAIDGDALRALHRGFSVEHVEVEVPVDGSRRFRALLVKLADDADPEIVARVRCPGETRIVGASEHTMVIGRQRPDRTFPLAEHEVDAAFAIARAPFDAGCEFRLLADEDGVRKFVGDPYCVRGTDVVQGRCPEWPTIRVRSATVAAGEPSGRAAEPTVWTALDRRPSPDDRLFARTAMVVDGHREVEFMPLATDVDVFELGDLFEVDPRVQPRWPPEVEIEIGVEPESGMYAAIARGCMRSGAAITGSCDRPPPRTGDAPVVVVERKVERYFDDEDTTDAVGVYARVQQVTPTREQAGRLTIRCTFPQVFEASDAVWFGGGGKGVWWPQGWLATMDPGDTYEARASVAIPETAEDCEATLFVDNVLVDRAEVPVA